jgi:16S rRNA (guanine1207-N2)-methyltransferase
MTDRSLIAVAAAKRTMWLNEFEHYDVVAGDTYDPVHDGRYHLIVSNPPFHRGRNVDHTMTDRLLSEAPRYLAPDGELLVVANAFLSYGKQMRRHFHQVETVVSNRRYHLLRAWQPIR